ncbi:hypothetical protein DM47_3217 [Burkholderia mallei]|nr:hypothetical protein DM47_3217 [Burkholderia mallei]
MEPGRRDLLAKRVLPAFRALRQRRVAHLLKHIFRVTARFATIGVDRHGIFPQKQEPV